MTTTERDVWGDVRFFNRHTKERWKGRDPVVRQGKEVAPGAFGPPAPGALLWPAFLGQEADTPSFPTPEREATEGASQRQQEMTEKDKTGREVRTTADLEQHWWAQCFVLSLSERITIKPPETDSSRWSFLALGWEPTGSACCRGFSQGLIVLPETFCCKPDRKNTMRGTC